MCSNEPRDPDNIIHKPLHLHLKIVVVGGQSVGKSLLLQRYSSHKQGSSLNSPSHSHAHTPHTTIAMDLLSFVINNFRVVGFDRSMCCVYAYCCYLVPVTYLSQYWSLAHSRDVCFAIRLSCDAMLQHSPFEPNTLQLDFFDISSAELHGPHIPLLFRSADAVMYVTDGTDASFATADEWRKHVPAALPSMLFVNCKSNTNELKVSRVKCIHVHVPVQHGMCLLQHPMLLLFSPFRLTVVLCHVFHRLHWWTLTSPPAKCSLGAVTISAAAPRPNCCKMRWKYC